MTDAGGRNFLPREAENWLGLGLMPASDPTDEALSLSSLPARPYVPVPTRAQAQTWPDKPITFIVPFGPGSGTDTITRVAAQHLGAALKQSVVVEDRPGANGALAALYVARSAPDGYTLFMAIDSTLVMNQYLHKSLPYEPLADFPLG